MLPISELYTVNCGRMSVVGDSGLKEVNWSSCSLLIATEILRRWQRQIIDRDVKGSGRVLNQGIVLSLDWGAKKTSVSIVGVTGRTSPASHRPCVSVKTLCLCHVAWQTAGAGELVSALKQAPFAKVEWYCPSSVWPQQYMEVSVQFRGFGGLEVVCWPLVHKFACSNPAEAVEFFRAKKSSARLPSKGK